MIDEAICDMSKPIRVLAIGHDAGMGGAQLSLLEILERLHQDKYLPIVLVPTPGPFVQAVRSHGLKCLWGLTQRWVFFKKPMSASVILRKPWRLLVHPYLLALISLVTLPVRVALLAAWAKKAGIGLVYSNTITVLDGALLARILGVPHIWHLRETVIGNPYLSFPFSPVWLPGFMLGWSDLVIVNSHALQRQLFGAKGNAKVRVIWNGINLGMDTGASPAVLAGVPPGVPLTAICGRLHERKGVLIYLAAAARLQQQHPDAHHLVIGEGRPEYLNMLHEEVVRLGLNGHVHFLGYRGDARNILSGVNILVSASTLESFGRTLIEAMAMGIPVIATRSGGPEEIIVDGESGFLVEINDESAIAERMSMLLNDHELSRTIGAAGRRRVMEHFDLSKTVAKIEKVFEHAYSGDTGCV